VLKAVRGFKANMCIFWGIARTGEREIWRSEQQTERALCIFFLVLRGRSRAMKP